MLHGVRFLTLFFRFLDWKFIENFSKVLLCSGDTCSATGVDIRRKTSAYDITNIVRIHIIYRVDKGPHIQRNAKCETLKVKS